MADPIDTAYMTSSETDSDCSEESFSDSDFFVEEDAIMLLLCKASSSLDTRLSGIQPYQFEPAIEVEDDHTAESAVDMPEDSDRNGRLLNTNWCSCDNCQLMPSVSESICCQEIARVHQKCQEDYPPATCITHHADFQAVCLNKGVLDTAYYQYRQQYEPLGAKRPDERYRYVAYRQLVRWCWMYLGKEVWRVLPSCAVSCIRETFPSPYGDYGGFKLD